MDTIGYHTRHEILTQPKAWAAALQVISTQAGVLSDFFTSEPYEMVIFTGCGSTYYLSLAAAASLQALTGLISRGLPASEIWLDPQTSCVTERRTLLIAVSRSGATTETLRACETFRAATGSQILTLSCYPDTSLAQFGDLNLVLPSGQEQSVAQTRAFSTLYLATTALTCLWADQAGSLAELNKLPDAATRLLADYRPLAQRLGRDANLDRIYFLGSGARYGLACELSLKMKEMSLTHSEPFHFLEFRHGPKSMVTPGTLLVGLLSEANQTHEKAVLADMKAQGAQICALGETDTEVRLDSGLNETLRNVLYLPFGQWLAFERATSKNLNPDRPSNLDAVVKLT